MLLAPALMLLGPALMLLAPALMLLGPALMLLALMSLMSLTPLMYLGHMCKSLLRLSLY